MSGALSPNTQAVLLLTAPLIAGRGDPPSELLTAGEYKRLARFLRESKREPADLLAADANDLLDECHATIDSARLARLLGRGFLLSQTVEHWQARAIWVLSRADADYPKRLKARLREDAPPVLYGCGEASMLNSGGLAIVGSRNADATLIEYTESVGRLAAAAHCAVVSGGARGIDQAAMRGALEAGGTAIGVLPDGLERVALARDHREVLMDARLVLISAYDPAAGFNVGHAMQRNKLIYALADAALVVAAEYEKGGTWAGAVEQLDKLKLVPIYVRSQGSSAKGLDAMVRKGALPWPNPLTPDDFVTTLSGPPDQPSPPRDATVAPHEPPSVVREVPAHAAPTREEEAELELFPDEAPVSGGTMPFSVSSEEEEEALFAEETAGASGAVASPMSPADELFATVRELLGDITTPMTEVEVATRLQVSKGQAKDWLARLVKEGVLEKLSKPTRYCSASVTGRLLL